MKVLPVIGFSGERQMDVMDKGYAPYRDPSLPEVVMPACPIEKKLKVADGTRHRRQFGHW